MKKRLEQLLLPLECWTNADLRRMRLDAENLDSEQLLYHWGVVPPNLDYRADKARFRRLQRTLERRYGYVKTI